MIFVKRFEHDCNTCVFLGQFEEYDLYYHPGLTLQTEIVIARYGDEGEDYMSGIAFGKNGSIPALTEALKRAEQLGGR